METEPTEPPGSPNGVPARQPTFEVEIQDATGRLDRCTLDWFRRHVVGAAGVLACSGEARVRVVGDAEMRAAHARHLGEDSTTDVLTFDLREARTGSAGDASERLDVDVLVCVDEADRQASERGHPASHELLLYVVHAMLHCLGYDDHDEASGAAMHAREDEVLVAIGVGSVYRAVCGGTRCGASGVGGGS